MTAALYQKARTKRASILDFADRIERSGLFADKASALVAKLRRCRPRFRCYSPACPACARVEQVLMASVVEDFVAGQEGECSIAFASIISPNSIVPKGSLLKFDFHNFKRRLRDGLAKTAALWAVGGVDFSLNEHQRGFYPPNWSPHLHLIVGTEDIDQLIVDLRAGFPKTNDTPRPVMVKQWDGNTDAFRYIFKPNFSRRISIDNAERFNKRTQERRLCKATTYDRLRVSERVELALFLDKIGLGGRLSLRNVSLRKTTDPRKLELRRI